MNNEPIKFPLQNGPIDDLPEPIMEDVKACVVAYFGFDRTLDENDWDVERQCKVMVDSKTGNLIFCKIVYTTDGTPKVAVLHLPQSTVDEWIKI